MEAEQSIKGSDKGDDKGDDKGESIRGYFSSSTRTRGAGASEPLMRMSPALDRTKSAGPPALIFPCNTLEFGFPLTVVVTGKSLRTCPPLLRASRLKPAFFGKVRFTLPPETSNRQSSAGCATRFAVSVPLVVLA